MVGGVPDPGLGGDLEHIVVKDTAEGGLELIADDEGDTVNRGEQSPGIPLHFDAVVAGNRLPIGQKFTLQTAGDQHGIPYTEHDVPLSLRDRSLLLTVAADLLHL